MGKPQNFLHCFRTRVNSSFKLRSNQPSCALFQIKGQYLFKVHKTLGNDDNIDQIRTILGQLTIYYSILFEEQKPKIASNFSNIKQ